VVNLRFRVENVSSYPSVLNRDNHRRRTPEELLSPTTTVKRGCDKATGRREEGACHNHDCPVKSSIESIFTPDSALFDC
jgi:hypothetical protein